LAQAPLAGFRAIRYIVGVWKALNISLLPLVATPEEQLAALRARIDATDRQLAILLDSRIGIIREVAQLKARHWPGNCHIRPGREGQMHAAIAERFNNSAFSSLSALAIWRQLIGASTHLESPLTVTTLESYPEHIWMAREYFGIQINSHTALTLTDAFVQLTVDVSNILLLPAPLDSKWWHHVEAISSAGLFIFASLPVVEGHIPEGTTPALALGEVAPEDSGDDLSYHYINGKIHVVDGFVPDAAGGIFLGAHPRPIHLR
jgi:chorismate mutase